MTESPPAQYDWNLADWNPSARRQFSLIVLAIAATLLVATMVYGGFQGPYLGTALWVILGVLGVLCLAQVLVVATGLGAERSEPYEEHPTHEHGPEPVKATPDTVHVDLKCPECSELFTVEDTGERPLPAICPNCQAEGHVDIEGEPETIDTHEGHDDTLQAQADWAQPSPQESPGPTLVKLECPECNTQFEVEDTGERPLETQCPGCAREGHLR